MLHRWVQVDQQISNTLQVLRTPCQPQAGPPLPGDKAPAPALLRWRS